MENKTFYRYEARVYSAGVDQFGDPIRTLIPNVKIELREFGLVKETPKGYWIKRGYQNNVDDLFNLSSLLYGDKKRWVSKTSIKRYAYPTKEEAINNYIKRSERRASILKSQLDVTEYGIMAAKTLQEGLTPSK